MSEIVKYVRPNGPDSVVIDLRYPEAMGEYRAVVEPDELGSLIMHSCYLYVSKGNQGKGIGKELMSAMRGEAIEREVERIELEVSVAPALVIAQRVYGQDGITYTFGRKEEHTYEQALARLSGSTRRNIFGIIENPGSKIRSR